MAEPDLLPPKVLGIAESREAVPQIAKRFRAEGVSATPVFFGAQRRAEGVMIPVQLFEEFQEVFEDLVIAHRVAERLAEDDGTRLTLEEMDTRHGWSRETAVADAAEMASEMGLA